MIMEVLTRTTHCIFIYLFISHMLLRPSAPSPGNHRYRATVLTVPVK